jgi:hypothetical protein
LPLRPRQTARAEPLEPRALLSALIVNDTTANDTITLGATPAGGVKVVINGAEADYPAGQWDSVLVSSNAGSDTINVQATVVPTTIHYRMSAAVNVGDASGVQHIAAMLNINGANGGPVLPGSAVITIDDSGDAAARQVRLVTQGEQEQITGLAAAEIDLGVVSPPVTPLALASTSDSFTLTTGSGDDTVTVEGLNRPAGFINAGGHDAVNIGNGSLARIESNVVVEPTYVFPAGTQTALTVDDSQDKSPAQFTISALFPPGPGAFGSVAVQGSNVPQSSITFRTAGVPSATVDGGSGGNTFHVVATPPGSLSTAEVLTFNSGAGNDTILVDTTNSQSVLNVNGQSGEDTLKTGPVGPFLGILGPLRFDGGTGANSLVVQGPVVNPFDIAVTPVTVSAGLVAHFGIEISYRSVSQLRLENGRFHVTGDLGPISLSVASEPSSVMFELPTSVEFASSQNLDALDLLSGPATLTRGGGIVLNCTSLNITGTSLDLADNTLQVHYPASDPFATIRGWILNRTIFSSAADAHHNVGYADSADGIVPNLTGQTILAKYALYGDANLDGQVNFADLLRLGQNYGRTGANWDQGDFNYDSKVNFDDLLRLAQNYGAHAAASTFALRRIAR